jgi:hypothetical protein
MKSTDSGNTWHSIAGDLPENGPLLGLAEDQVDPSLLFAGTEFGLFFTRNGGQHWIQLKGGLPTIPVRDVVVQSRENDLVLATFGRGFYVLDDATALRLLTPELLAKSSVLLPTKDALLYVERRPLGVPKKGMQGENFYAAENPPFGAVFTYYLKEELKTKAERRHDAEEKAAKAGKTLPYPTRDQLRAESEEQKPEIFLMVYDESGKPLRRVNGETAAGIHRAAWDLRYPTPALKTEGGSEGDEDWPSWRNMGPLVMPGEYSVRLFQKMDDKISPLAGPLNFNVIADGASAIRPADRAAITDFQRKAAGLYRAVSGAESAAQDLDKRLKEIRRALQETPSLDPQLAAGADRIQQQNDRIQRTLRGDIALRARNENVSASIEDRVSSIMDGQRFAIARPTQTHVCAYNIASQEFASELARLRQLLEIDLPQLEKAMEAAGAPWTPGRLPQISK